MIFIKKLTTEEVAESFFEVIKELRPQIKSKSELSQLLLKISKSEDIHFFGAFQDGVAAGFGNVSIKYSLAANGKYAFIYDLIVSETMRSKGIGEKIIKKIEEFAKDKNCNSLELESGTSRDKAHKFYFREGFSISCYNFVKKI